MRLEFQRTGDLEGRGRGQALTLQIHAHQAQWNGYAVHGSPRERRVAHEAMTPWNGGDDPTQQAHRCPGVPTVQVQVARTQPTLGSAHVRDAVFIVAGRSQLHDDGARGFDVLARREIGDRALAARQSRQT